MNRLSIKILIISIAVFSAGFLLIPTTFVQAANLEVEFEKTPLFKETNFLPGEVITRWIKVTNNSGQTQKIATEAINYPDPTPEYDLSRALMIAIKEGATDLYGGSSPTGPKSLYDFYQDSEIYPEISLSDLENGKTTQYDFKISFPLEKENEWQDATTTFDILIGFQQGTSPLPPSPPAPPPGGGALPPGLTILDESIEILSCCETNATIIWSTSYLSTSRVIYSAEGQSHTLNLSAPNYGYASSKEGDDTAIQKVINHSVTITGISPETTYYYRCVSHASPSTVSREYKFSTPKIGTCFAIEEQIVTEGGVAGGVLPEGVPGPEETGEEEIEETQVIAEIEEQGLNLTAFLAAIGSFFTSTGFSWLILLIIIILTILFLLSLTKKRPEKKKNWIWLFGILALIIFYCYFYCTNCWLLILILAILIILFLLYKKKSTEEFQQP